MADYRALRPGTRIVEIQIHFGERHSGSGKINLAIRLDALVVPWRSRAGGRR